MPPVFPMIQAIIRYRDQNKKSESGPRSNGAPILNDIFWSCQLEPRAIDF
jgi:hypothetical protein